MKYRILVLLALMCAILVAAVSGTLAGYTDEAAFSFSIRPDTSAIHKTQQAPEAQSTADAEPTPSAESVAESVAESTAEPAPVSTEEASSDEMPADGETAVETPQTNE